MNFVQHAGVEALSSTDDAVEEMRQAFADRREILVDLLAEHGVDVADPKGAFYMMLPRRRRRPRRGAGDLRGTGRDRPRNRVRDARLRSYLLRQQQERLHEAVDRLAEAA